MDYHTNFTKKDFKAFRALFIAPSDYGKSYLVSLFVLDLLKKKIFHPKRVVLFSTTYKTDQSQQMLTSYCQSQYKGFLEHNCFENINEEFLVKLYDGQKKIKETKPELLKNWLFIMDDMISADILTDKKSPLVKLYCTMRHFNISSILNLQAYRGTLSSTCRKQITIIAVGRLASQGEIEDILAEYNQGCGKTKKEALHQILEFWEDAITDNNNHGFLVIYTNRQFGQGKLQQGFNGKFYDGNSLADK